MMVKNCLNCCNSSEMLSNFKDQIFCIRTASHRIPNFYCRLFEPDRTEWNKEKDYLNKKECPIGGHERRV